MPTGTMSSVRRRRTSWPVMPRRTLFGPMSCRAIATVKPTLPVRGGFPYRGAILELISINGVPHMETV